MTSKLYGLCYSPYRDQQDPIKGPRPTTDQVNQDLGFISQFTDRIRVYSSQGALSNITQIATKYNLRINLELCISDDIQCNENEIREATKIINGAAKSCLECVTVGNEVLARKEWRQSSISSSKLLTYTQRIKTETSKYDIPVTIAEPWYIWKKYSTFASSVDIVTVPTSMHIGMSRM